MKREVLLLTKSKKYGGYCATGVDVDTGEWIRFVVDGYDTVPKHIFKYKDNKEPQILDTMLIDVIKNNLGNDCHPEDVLVNNYFEKSNKNGINYLFKRVQDDYNKHDTIYYNQFSKVADRYLRNLSDEQIYSLLIIEPQNIEFYRIHTEKLCVSFTYKGRKYTDIRVTDEKIIEKFAGLNNLNHGVKYPIECYFVISLGEKYEDGNRYKLLASVIDKESIYLSEHSYNKGQPFYYMREDTNQLQCCILKYYDEITDCLVAKNPDYPNVDLVFSKDLVGNVVFLTSKEALNRSAMSNEASLQVEDSKTRELNEESSTLNKDFDDHIEEIDDNKNSKRQNSIIKKYLKWTEKFPGFVVLMKSGYFYSAYGESAEVLNKVFGYKLGYSSFNNIPVSGGSSLNKLQNGLKNRNYKYIVISHDEIIDRYDANNVKDDDQVKNSNDYDKLVNIINCIKNGVDPDTGEIIGDNRFLLNSDIRKIFDLAEEYIINKTSVESDNEKKHEQTDDEQEVYEDVDDSITEWIRNVEKKYYDRLK